MAGKTLDESGVEKKFLNAKNTQESIQSISTWALHYKAHHSKIVEIWFSVLKRSKPQQRLTLFYLCNEIVQTCKRKHATAFKDSFKQVLVEATGLAREPSLRSNIERIFTVWRERNVFDADFVEELLLVLAESKTTTTVAVAAKLVGDFKPSKARDMMLAVAELEKEIELKRRKLNAVNIDESGQKYLKHLKDRSHGKQYSQHIEEQHRMLDEYVAGLEKEMACRQEMIEQLEQSELFYDIQYGEAKIVTNAYKNFGTRVSNLRKRLDDVKKTLPDPLSPIPSPSIDAPSPGDSLGDNAAEQAPDNTEAIDMELSSNEDPGDVEVYSPVDEGIANDLDPSPIDFQVVVSTTAGTSSSSLTTVPVAAANTTSVPAVPVTATLDYSSSFLTQLSAGGAATGSVGGSGINLFSMLADLMSSKTESSPGLDVSTIMPSAEALSSSLMSTTNGQSTPNSEASSSTSMSVSAESNPQPLSAGLEILANGLGLSALTSSNLMAPSGYPAYCATSTVGDVISALSSSVLLLPNSLTTSGSVAVTSVGGNGMFALSSGTATTPTVDLPLAASAVVSSPLNTIMSVLSGGISSGSETVSAPGGPPTVSAVDGASLPYYCTSDADGNTTPVQDELPDNPEPAPRITDPIALLNQLLSKGNTSSPGTGTSFLHSLNMFATGVPGDGKQSSVDASDDAGYTGALTEKAASTTLATAVTEHVAPSHGMEMAKPFYNQAGYETYVGAPPLPAVPSVSLMQPPPPPLPIDATASPSELPPPPLPPLLGMGPYSNTTNSGYSTSMDLYRTRSEWVGSVHTDGTPPLNQLADGKSVPISRGMVDMLGQTLHSHCAPAEVTMGHGNVAPALRSDVDSAASMPLYTNPGQGIPRDPHPSRRPFGLVPGAETSSIPAYVSPGSMMPFQNRGRETNDHFKSSLGKSSGFGKPSEPNSASGFMSPSGSDDVHSFRVTSNVDDTSAPPFHHGSPAVSPDMSSDGVEFVERLRRKSRHMSPPGGFPTPQVVERNLPDNHVNLDFDAVEAAPHHPSYYEQGDVEVLDDVGYRDPEEHGQPFHADRPPHRPPFPMSACGERGFFCERPRHPPAGDFRPPRFGSRLPPPPSLSNFGPRMRVSPRFHRPRFPRF